MKSSSLKVIVVVGPTASGKSDFAVLLAKEINGEVISADSRQVYKGLDIGTGKITEEEMQGVKHYGLSLYDLDEKISVVKYKEDMDKLISDILSRGKPAIICGGTGQYIDALIYKNELPKVKPNQNLRDLLETYSTEALYDDLLQKDPGRAQAIDKHNRVRLIRALEIVEELGTVPLQEENVLRYETEIYLLSPSKEVLRSRVLKRVEKRMEQGMLDEVSNVLRMGYTDEATLKRFGIEYYVLSKYLQGELTENETKQILINKIMQYAKRQMTWNKKYLPIAQIIEVKE